MVRSGMVRWGMAGMVRCGEVGHGLFNTMHFLTEFNYEKEIQSNSRGTI